MIDWNLGNASLRVLLVDDSDVIRKITALMLKKLGHHVDLATDGIDAIGAIENKSYDLVLTDIQMPNMDGLEAIKIIRRRWCPGPKIIVVTSLFDYRDVCLEAGADDFLIKPLRIKMLSNSIECLMSIQNINLFIPNSMDDVADVSSIT